jgi:predicted secreted protein
MRHRHAVLAALLVLAPLSGAPVSRAWADDTRLSLSETATVTIAPDELQAVLHAEATAPTASEAQRAVNAAMADALARAKQAPGIVAATGGYGVYRDTSSKPERWQASQTLALHSADGAALLTLVGALQQKGLAVDDLHWQLSDDATRKAQAEAMRRAIAALRAHVDEAAGLLGLSFVRFVSVQLQTPPLFRPQMRAMAMATASSAPAPTPPSAAAEDVPVSATVSAEASLAPK